MTMTLTPTRRRHYALCLVVILFAAVVVPTAVDALSQQGTSSVANNGRLQPLPTTAMKRATTRNIENSSLNLGTDGSNNDPEMEYIIKVGRALDTLRKDYPQILTQNPDFGIYDHRIEVVDPNGVKVKGIQSYKSAFNIMHTLIKCLYCTDKSSMTSFKMCHDKARENIRIQWHVQLVPRRVYSLTGVASKYPLNVDGISVYEISKASGDITQHRFETLLFNNAKVEIPEEGMIHALQRQRLSVPSFFMPEEHFGLVDIDQGLTTPNSVVPFASWPTFAGRRAAPTSLFAFESSATNEGENTSKNNNNAVDTAYPGLDYKAFDAKNKSRQKFGLQPLTPEQFMDVDNQVREMDAVQRDRAEKFTKERENKKSTKKNNDGNFFNTLFGIKDTCESNFDCERPELCCDFGFVKKCCSSGTMIRNAQLVPAYVPVPVDVNMPTPPPRRY